MSTEFLMSPPRLGIPIDLTQPLPQHRATFGNLSVTNQRNMADSLEAAIHASQLTGGLIVTNGLTRGGSLGLGGQRWNEGDSLTEQIRRLREQRGERDEQWVPPVSPNPFSRPRPARSPDQDRLDQEMLERAFEEARRRRATQPAPAPRPAPAPSPSPEPVPGRSPGQGRGFDI